MSSADQKYRAVLAQLREYDGVLIAFSGGVDSSLLLLAAREALGSRTLAVSVISPFLPERERDEAARLDREIGELASQHVADESFMHMFLEIDPLAEPALAANDVERCYYCKDLILARLVEVAREEGLSHVLEGSNWDDRSDYRPGARAVREHGVRSPLRDAELTKSEIRALARAKGLSNWDKPAMACLASRIPYGTPLTRECLARIDRAEEMLLQHGFRQFRVRDHGVVARIEVAPAEIGRMLDADRRAEITQALQALGYRYVALDLEGYRTGALNPPAD